jgi:two-component system phosphate regulon sensor histidine kinase PhoR
MIQPKLGQAISSEFDLDCLPARTVLSRMTPLAASGGAVIVAHDVTDIRRLERVRRDFVANVSHELRTPVSVIRANAETLLDGALDDRSLSEEFVSAVLRNSERLSNLIGDLLDLSQIEAGHYEMNLVRISVSGAIRRTIDSVGHAANKKNMTISQAGTLDVQVLADMQALDQVLSNLVENAVKYTPVGGTVVIRSVAFEGAIRIEIEDDGVGVAPEHRDRLFERFYRVDPGRSRQMGGTGLGLAIVKHLVGAMGGLVGMRPSPEQGSIFWVELPLLK